MFFETIMEGRLEACSYLEAPTVALVVGLSEMLWREDSVE